MTTETKPATKLVAVRLAAFVRVEHTEFVEVPANITKAELQQLVDARYDRVDGGDYTDDPEYWAKGECWAEPCDTQGVAPTLMAFRVDGGLHIEPAIAMEHDHA